MRKTDSASLPPEYGIRNPLHENFLPLLLAAGVFAIFVAIARNKIPNLPLYAASCALFFVAYFICRLAGKGRLTIRSCSSLPVELCVLLLAAGLLALNFIREGRGDQGSDFNESLFRYQIPRWQYLLLLAATTAASCFLLKACARSGRHRLFRAAISLPYLCVLSCTVWIPNIFYSLHTFYHAHAYYSSLCDVLNLAPLGNLNRPYYGHYALFFLLPGQLCRLLGIPGNIAIATFVAACNLVTLLSTLYVVDKLVKNDGVFLVVLLSLADPYLMMMPKLHFIKDVYLQMIPHRVLFPALISAFMTAFSGKTFGRRHIAVLFLQAALSLVWSPEIGLVCTASVALHVFLRLCDWSAPLSAANARRLLLCAVLSALSSLAAWLLVLLYDLPTGSQGVSFATFMYPMLGDFKGIAVRGPLPDQLRPWFSVLLFFLTAIAILATQLPKHKGDKGKSCTLLSLSVIALGLFSYYIDSGLQVRLMIVYFQFLMLFACLLDFLASQANSFRTGSAPVLLALAVSSTFVLGNAGMKEVLTDRRASAWQLKSLSQFAKELDREIPEGTLAFGWGVSDLFAAMDRDPGVHVIDWVNITQDKNPAFLAHVNGLLEKTDSFFAYEDSASLLPASNSFAPAKEYEYKGWKFALYRRK